MTDDNVIPLFQHEPDWGGMVRFMERHGIPVTRENYLRMEYFGDPPEWSAELEEQLPPQLRDDSRTFGHPNDAPRQRGYLHLSSEEFEDDLKHN